MHIKILGSGCKKCLALAQNTKAAAQSAGIDIEIEKVTDVVDIAKFGVMSTPGLVVNDKVVSVGRVLPEQEIVPILEQAR